MTVTLIALLAASGALPNTRDILPSEVNASLQHALVVPAARIVPVRWTGVRGCRLASVSVPRPIEGSGRVPVKITGRGCSGWGWAELQVWAETSVTRRVVHVGELVAPASAVEEREVHAGQLPFIVPADAIAVRSLPVGASVGAMDVSQSRVGVGDPIKVRFISGSVAIETDGRRTQCLRTRDCAILSSGKHVEGRIDDDGRLVVEVPR